MKIKLITFIKLKCYYSVFSQMRKFRPHVTDNDAVQMFEYWEEVYRSKITALLKGSSDKLLS